VDDGPLQEARLGVLRSQWSGGAKHQAVVVLIPIGIDDITSAYLSHPEARKNVCIKVKHQLHPDLPGPLLDSEDPPMVQGAHALLVPWSTAKGGRVHLLPALDGLKVRGLGQDGLPDDIN